MPRAGWCRECGEWIWVDEEGACQHGHGPECVGGIYDADPRSPERSVGEGEMPPSFNRFNWGAFLLPFFWGTAYGVWPVVSFWLLALITPYILFIIAGTGGDSSIQASVVGITVVSEVVGGAVRIYIGANANRLLWAREKLRLEVVEGSLPRVVIGRFLARQRVWMWVGWVLTALSLVAVGIIGFANGELGVTVRENLGVTRLDAAVSVVWLAAEVILGMWLASKMRAEGDSAPSDAAEDAA